jgi:hypothetical protein
MAWITNMQHYLDEDGSIDSLNRPIKRLADYFGAIVTFATSFDDEPFFNSDIQCRRRPGKKPCQGKIQALLELDTDRIIWRCPVCGDNGAIVDWENTPWDAS